MKRHGDLWATLTSFENLHAAARKASRGKRRKGNVARFHFNLEGELCRLQDELRARTYAPGGYNTFEIFDPKRRLISAAPYRDRVVHHALCRVLEPLFERSFIFDSYASRPGKGTHAALDRFTRFARHSKYVFKCDVRKFFPSVDHEILKSLVARKIKDPDILWLVSKIIDGSNPQEAIVEWFPGDDLLAPLLRRRGLPIGNQTSQFFGNVYLDPFDHFVKETLRMPYYVRYVDDFVILADDKQLLAKVRDRCRSFLATLRLQMHPRKCIISRIEDGTRFLGFRVFPTHRLLPRSHVVRFRRRLKGLALRYAQGQATLEEVRRRVAGWLGHARHASSFRLRRKLFAATTFRRRIP